MEIVLVEDNPADAELALLAIRQSGYPGHVVHVDDGLKVMDYLHGRGAFAASGGSASPRVILLDLNLPGMNGIDVLRLIKGDARLATIPIVMLTSSQELSDVANCYRLGVNSFVVKPVGFEAYRAVMAELMSYWTRTNLAPVAPLASR